MESAIGLNVLDSKVCDGYIVIEFDCMSVECRVQLSHVSTLVKVQYVTCSVSLSSLFQMTCFLHNLQWRKRDMEHAFDYLRMWQRERERGGRGSDCSCDVCACMWVHGCGWEKSPVRISMNWKDLETRNVLENVHACARLWNRYYSVMQLVFIQRL